MTKSDASSTTVVLKLRTTTPRVVGILIDMEHYVFRLYTDWQLNSTAKEAALTPGEWTPFVKIKRRDNVAILNPFCTRCATGLSDESYISPDHFVSYQHGNSVAVLNLPDKVVPSDDVSFIRESVTGIEDPKWIRHCAVAKDKDKKCLKVAVIEFKDIATKEKVIAEWDKKDKSKVEFVHGEQLYDRISKVWTAEKMAARNVLGVVYKPKKFAEMIVASSAGTPPTSSPAEAVTTPLALAPPADAAKAPAVISTAVVVVPLKTEEKKEAPVPAVPTEESKKAAEAKKIKREMKAAFRACLTELNADIVKEYKEAITLLLKGKNPPQVGVAKKPDEEQGKVVAMYLPQSDNILLVKGSMMKLLDRAHGQFEVPNAAFYNNPVTAKSHIALGLQRKEAEFVLQNMKWRALGELMYKSYAWAVYEFVYSLLTQLKEQSGPNVQIPMTYLAGKVTVDVALKAIATERLFRTNKSLLPEQNELRVFALTSSPDLEYLLALFCRMEEMLWSMAQNPLAENSLRSLWSPSHCRMQSAYSRLLSFQSGKNRLPDEVALAEAGLIQREDSTIVHFEEPLSGRVSPNVPMHETVNNFAPSVHVDLAGQPQKVTNVQSAWKQPLVLVSSADGTIEVWNSRVCLTRLLVTSLKSGSDDIWKSYGSAKITVDEEVSPVMPNVAPTEESYSLDLLFAPIEEVNLEGVSASAMMSAQKQDKVGPIEVDEVTCPMLLTSEETARTTCPISVAAVVKDKKSGKHYIRIRKYGYFSEFLKYALCQLDGAYTTPFDGTTFHTKDRAGALEHIFGYIMCKGYTFGTAQTDKVFGLVSEQTYSLESIARPLAAYAVSVAATTYFNFNVFETTEKGEVVAHTFKWTNSEKDFKFVADKSLGVTSPTKDVRVKYSDEFAIVVHEAGIHVYSLATLEPIEYIPLKLSSGRLDAVFLQGSTVIVQEGEQAELFSVEREKVAKKEPVVESLGKLQKDVRPEDLASVDLAAYGNAEGTIAVPAKGVDNEYSVLCSTVPADGTGETRNTWNVVGKGKRAEYDFEVETRETNEVESLEVELKFSKDSLTAEEREKINKAITLEEKKPENEHKRAIEGEDSHLPLVVVWHKGAAHNHTMSVTRMLTCDGKEFKSNYPQPAFIFAHQHHKQFLIKKCVVKSPIASGDKCHPIGSGIIYIANHLSAFKNLTHNFTKEAEYTAWLEKRKQCKLELQSFEPAGFFQMGDGADLVFNLNVERPCKYIYLKPTAFRSKPTEIKQFASFPMTIEYFGVTGTAIETGMAAGPAWKKSLEIQDAKLPTGCDLEVQAYNAKDKAWQKLATMSGIDLIGLEIKDKTVRLLDKDLAAQSQSAFWKTTYEEKELHKTATNRYRLRVLQPAGKDQWQLAGLSLKVFASKRVERQGELFKHISSSYLWKCMNEPELFGRVNKALCELVCMSDRDYNDRIKAMSLLRKIVECGQEQFELVRKHIDLEKFIKANVYQEQTENFAMRFLQLFQQFPDFTAQLHDFAVRELSDIHKLVLRPAGIAGLKSILAIIIPKAPEFFLQQLIGKIYEISTKYIESILTEEHIFLRTRLDVHSYPLSPFAWVAPAHGKTEAKVTQAFGEGKKSPASVRCAFICTGNACRFVLDCVKVHDVSSAVLYFKKDTTAAATWFDVAIYGVPEDGTGRSRLIFAKEYPTHVWERLTSTAYSPDKTKFDEKDELDSLVIPLGACMCRYVIVDLTLRRGFDPDPRKVWGMNAYLKDGVMAEVYGIPQAAEGKPVPELEAVLNVEESQKATKRVGHSANYEKIQSAKTHVELCRLKEEGQTTKVDVKAFKAEENVELQLANTQKQLHKEIRKYRDGQAPKEAIIDLITQVEGLQRIQCQTAVREQVEGGKCVEYLVQICLELAGIITDIVGKNPQMLGALKKQTACNVVTLIKVLFRDFVVFNAGYPREEMLQFIQNVLLQEASEAEWIKLILEIVEDFLSRSQTLYSQKSVIDCLERFNIPEGELLSYLAKKMRLKELVAAPTDLTGRKRSSSRDQLEREIFPQLSSSLVLAIKSLRKLPIEDPNAVVHRGITCNYCGNKKPIVGMRYKCGHCPNVNVCSKTHCIKKHEDEHRDHVLIAIPKPLPYGPTKAPESAQFKILLPQMKLNHGSKVHEGIECDNCGAKSFEGTRYLCANCDYYNLCEKCYTGEKFSHTKTHVFLRLPEPLIQSETATPKACMAHLDPDLYPTLKPQQSDVPKEPLELKRSLSAYTEKKMDFERLDVDQTLQVAYRICIWICHSSVMDNKQKATALKLSAELLCILLKLSSVDAVGGVIQEDTQLDVIISAYLEIEEDKAVRKSLVKLIAGLKDVSIKTMSLEEVKELPPGERRDYLTKVEKTLSIRLHLSTCLHQILKSLIENAPKGKAAEYVDIDSLTLLLDSYVSILDSITSTKEMLKKYKVIKDEEQEIVLPDLTRSLSQPVSAARMVRPKARFTKPSLQLALGLIALLESLNPLTIGSMYGKMWEIVLKILSKINMKQVIEAKLFERLMGSFFLSTVHIQETIYRQLLDISGKMMQFSNTTTMIINLIRSTLDGATNTAREEMAFYICRGWLDILLTGKSPKQGKAKKDQPKVAAPEVFARMELSDVLDLLSFASSYLLTNLNFGCYRGVMGGKYKVMYRAILGARMVAILSGAKGKDGKKLAIQELMETSKDPKLTTAFTNLLFWLFLNYNKNDTSCKLTQLICKISKSVKRMFKCVGVNDGLCKTLLGTLEEVVVTADKNLLKRVESGDLRINLAVELNERVNKLLKRMMKYIMASTVTATYFAFDLKGFDFLFNRLGISKEVQPDLAGQVTSVVDSDLMEGVSETIQVVPENSEKAEPTDNGGKKEQFSPNLLLDEDFAKDMNLIECTGETNLSSLHHINWCTYKGGQRSKIYTKQFKEGGRDEVVMAFELKKYIEIKEIQLSFINFWGMDNFEHLDVSSVTVDIGTAKSMFSYLCTLDKVHDKSLEVHGVTVFGRNMSAYDEAISKSDPIAQKLNSLKNAKAKYIRFTIRTGVKVAFSGTQASKSNKQKALGINYFSIIGYDSSGVTQVPAYISSKNQKVAYKLLNMFQLKTFRGCLKDFANTPAITNQLKVNFHTLASLMTPEKPTIEPFLIALCTHNADLGKWILQELIRSRESKGSALFMVQICLSNLEKVGESQALVLSFILKELEQLEQKRVEKPDAPKSLSQFVLHYVSLLYLVSPLIKDPIILSVGEEELIMVLRQVLMFWDVPETKEAFTKLFLVLIKPPTRIVSKIDPLAFCAKHLMVPKDQHSLFLASYLALYSKEIGQKLMELVPTELALHNEQAAYDQLALLLNLTLDPGLKVALAEKKLALSIYEKLKNPQDKQTYMQPLSQNMMALVDELIKRGITGYPDNEKKLAEAMIQDLNYIKNIEEKDAISKLILNLMRAEKTVPVCLYNFDAECEQWKSLTSEDTLRKGKKRTFFLDTSLLQQKQKDVLLGALRDRIGVESEADRLFGSNWRLAFKEQGNPPQNSPERFRQFFEAVSNKGPFILFMSGMSEGKRAIVGGFTTTSFPQMPTSFQNGQQLEIKSAPESLFFYYSENKMHHFEIRNKGENFGYIYVDYANCGACVLGNYFLSFSYSYSYSNSIGSLSSLKCVDGNVTYLPYSFFVDTIEVWTSEQDGTAPTDSSDKDLVAPLTKVTAAEHTWYSPKSPYNAFRSNAVFNVPNHVTVKELCECVIGKTHVQLKLRNSGKLLDEKMTMNTINEELKGSADIIDIEFEIEKDAKDLLSDTGYKPETPILSHFEKLGGYISLIDAAKSSLAKWKNVKLSQRFHLYLEELMQFSKLADFFKSLLSNKKSKTFIFEIMAGTPDRDTSGKSKKETEAKEKKWEDEYNSAVTYCYNIISQLFANFSNIELREQASASNFMSLILTRMQKLSGEVPRKWQDKAEAKPEVVPAAPSTPVESKTEDPGKKKVRKGVGYSTQVGEIWDVDKYMKSKKAKNGQIAALISIIANFISCEKWAPDDAFIKTLTESSLLPLIETSLSSGSLLEMAKESDLVLVYLDLLDKFREKDKLATLLVDIDPHYMPIQREPIYKILKNLNELSNIFLKCMEKDSEAKSENESPKHLAEEIQKCYKRVMRVVEKMLQEKKSDVIKNILSMPLPQAYKALLRDLRFGYTNMRDEKGKYKHFYHQQAEQDKTTSQSKLIRLAQELADLSNALPDDHTNAIFIRVDEQRIDYMKAIIMGASNTPYAHGAFEYDIYCPANYPNESPKMNLTTTGSGAVRFNPNLYHDGKVCLSLLGTWRGTATENWDPKFSTILQVLMSIQAIVMSEEVYFNEPGFEGEIGKPEGERKNEAYGNIVRYCNIKFAMINQIKNPPKGFESVIRRHFYIKKAEILKEAHKWVEYADTHEAAYDGLVYDHNPEWCNKFKQSKTRYKEMIVEIVKELEQALNEIEPPKELAEEGNGGDVSKIKEKTQESTVFAGGESIEGVDVAEDTAEELAKKTHEKENKLSVEDVGVKDRWSRYIGAVGIDAVAKQAKSNVLVCGAGGLGIEIAKNLVLSGCKEFVLQDSRNVTRLDQTAQFFLLDSDLGKNRAEACIGRLQQLNYYVKVTPMAGPIPATEAELDAAKFSRFTVIIVTDSAYKTQLVLDGYCRKHKIALIIADVKGALCKVVNDFGTKFTVLDSDGEEAKECMIRDITTEAEGMVTTIVGQRHGFANGDTVIFKE